MKSVWADRTAMALGCFLGVCPTEKAFNAAYAYLKVKPIKPWGSALGSVAILDNPKQVAVVIVVICVERHTCPVELMGTIIHESVHVWQRHCELLGEREPGIEQEAYTIEQIAQTIMKRVSPVWTKQLSSRRPSSRSSKNCIASPKRSTAK